jgi:hypothetical protein
VYYNNVIVGITYLKLIVVQITIFLTKGGVPCIDFFFHYFNHKKFSKGKLFFDMGIVNEDSEKGYHAGL